MKTPLKRTAISFLLAVFSLLSMESYAQVTISCPANIEVDNDPGLCETVVTYTPPIGAGAGTNITTTLTGGLPSGASYPVGTTTVEYTVTNDEGDVESCTFDVVVNDTEDPVIICPDDIVVDANVNECTQVVAFPIPPATDNCGTVTVIQIGGLPSGSIFPLGESFLDFQTTDAAGNDGFCRIVVIVNDITPPAISCPGAIAVDVLNTCDTIINYVAPTGSDACGTATTVQIAGLGSGSAFPLGTTTETYEVTDADGNTATCSFDVTVNDSADPEIVDCPADIVQVAPIGFCEAVVNFDAPSALDNCPGVSIVQTEGPVSGSNFPVGVTNIEFTATDASENTSVCSFTVTLTESTLPEITCPPDIVAPNDPGECGAIVTYTPPVGTDNCPDPTTTLTAGLGSGASFPVGTTTVTYLVTDLSGNTATCSFTVTVTDTEAPAIDCPENIEVNSDPGLCEATVNFDIPTFTDNCPGTIISQTDGPASGSMFPIGNTEIEFTAEDDSGMQTVCTFDVVVADNELPLIDCPADISLTILSGACDTVVTYLPPTISDNCPGVVFGVVNGPASGTTLATGSYTVTYGAQDVTGNSAVCTFTINIEEANSPAFDCPTDIEVDAAPGDCDAVVTFDTPTATDPCSAVTVTQTGGPASGSAFPLGTTAIEFTAEDEFGNTETCNFNIEVIDAEAPIIECSDEVILVNDPGACGAIYTFDLPAASDNCPGVVVVVQTAGPVSGTQLPIGSTLFAFEGTDAAGNVSTCGYEVNVVDDEAPTLAACPDDVTIDLAPNVCDTIVAFTAPTATDNCGSVSITQTSGPSSGELLTPGIYTIEFTALDDSGNPAICSFEIVVQDITPPSIVCPNSFETCNPVVDLPLPTVTDSCGIASLTQTGGPASGTPFPLGISTITFEVGDINGNTSECSYEVEVLAQATRPELGLDRNICDSTTTIISGNSPDFGMGLWFQTEGSGTIVSPESPVTEVTNLSDGVNTFVWAISPDNGCDILTDSLNIFVEQGVIVDAGADQTVLLGGSAQLSGFVSPPDGTIQWNDAESLNCEDCLDPQATPDETTVYFLSYETPFGCTQSDSVTVRVTLQLPNTITPDGDGVNDVWNIPEIDKFPDVAVQIFNRWGVEVFSSAGYQEPWDGTTDGKELPVGSYYYIIDYNRDGKENLNGTVNIIR